MLVKDLPPEIRDLALKEREIQLKKGIDIDYGTFDINENFHWWIICCFEWESSRQWHDPRENIYNNKDFTLINQYIKNKEKAKGRRKGDKEKEREKENDIWYWKAPKRNKPLWNGIVEQIDRMTMEELRGRFNSEDPIQSGDTITIRWNSFTFIAPEGIALERRSPTTPEESIAVREEIERENEIYERIINNFQNGGREPVIETTPTRPPFVVRNRDYTTDINIADDDLF